MTEAPGQPAPDDGLLAGRYRRDSLLGQGGMGRVWRGTDELLGRDVAIKELTLPQGLGERERVELRTRMLREARTAAKLSHPSIVAIYDVVEADERPWIIMELVHASSLSELIRDAGGALPPDRVARYSLQLLEALTVAHARGVVHRDVKPGNALITDSGRVVLTDFGIAVGDGDIALTRTGVLVGSPAYLAPEVARGQHARPEADLWSLGTTIYAALAGRSPFQRDTPMATLTAIIIDDPPPPPEAGPLWPIIEGLLRKDPGERMSGLEAGRALRAVIEGRPAPAPEPPREAAPAIASPSLSAPPPPPSTAAASVPQWGPRRRRASRSAILTLAAMTVVALGIAAGLIVSALDGEDTDTASPAANSAGADISPEEETDAGEAEEPEATGPPEGMVLHEDGTGFSLHVPEDWDVRTQGSSVYFDNPAGGYLQVDQTSDPGDDARADWESFEPTAAGNFSNYELVRIEYFDAPGLERYITAADWEFTHTTSEHGDMRVVNRGFHTDEYGYAILVNLPETEWEAGGWDLLEEFTASFEPAG